MKFLARWPVRLATAAVILSGLLSSAGARAAEPRLKGFAPTAAERAWLAAHPKIRVGFDPAWPPFSVVDEKSGCVGIDADLLAMLGRELGVKFEFIARSRWEEVHAAAMRGEMDLLVGTALTEERAREFLFTEPYFSFPVVIVTRNDEPILWSVLDLAGRRIAGVRDYATAMEFFIP